MFNKNQKKSRKKERWHLREKKTERRVFKIHANDLYCRELSDVELGWFAITSDIHISLIYSIELTGRARIANSRGRCEEFKKY